MALQYRMLDRLKERWDRVGRKLAFRAENVEEFNAWKAELTATLKQLIGYDTMEQAPLNPQELGSEDKGDYVQHHMAIQTEPDVWMPMYVLIPKNGRGPFHPVIAAHGHGSQGKDAVAGIESSPDLAANIQSFNYDYGRKLCQAGFIVFCPDMRGFGERREPVSTADPLDGSCREINNVAFSLGQTLTGMLAWDIHRLVDYIAQRPDCRIDLLSCGGLSGGGLQTLWAAALDERIRSCVISGYFYGFKNALLEPMLHCACNYVPHLWEYADIGDIAALIAPRPLLIETGDVDSLNGSRGLENVYESLSTVKKAYALHGRPEALKHFIGHGAHRWYGDETVAWFRSAIVVP